MLFRPTHKVRRFTGAFLVPEITWNKLLPDREARVRGKHHVGQLRLRFDQMNARFDSLQRVMFQASVVFMVALLGIIGTRL